MIYLSNYIILKSMDSLESFLLH